MKGIENFEFVLSVFVFLSTISFVSMTIINKIPDLHQDSVGDEIKTNSFIVSELLLFDRGYPENWNESTVERFGFSNGSRYVISKQKLIYFNNICKNETEKQKIIDSLGFLSVNITKLNGSSVIYCETARPPIKMKIRRYAIMSNEATGQLTEKVKIDINSG